MAVLKLLSQPVSTLTGASADLSGGYSIKLDFLESWLCRVAILQSEGLRVPNTWMIAPQGEVPWQGRFRMDMSGFSCPEVTQLEEGWFQSAGIQVSVASESLALRRSICCPVRTMQNRYGVVFCVA